MRHQFTHRRISLTVLKMICYIAAALCFVLTFFPFFESYRVYLFAACYILLGHELFIAAFNSIKARAFYEDGVIILVISLITMLLGEMLDGVIIVAIWHVSNLIIDITIANGNDLEDEKNIKTGSNFVKHAKYIVPSFVLSAVILILVLHFGFRMNDLNTLLLSVIALSCPCPFIMGFAMLNIRTERALKRASESDAPISYSEKKRAVLTSELVKYGINSPSGKQLKVMNVARSVNISNIVAICILKILLIVLATVFDSVLIAVSSDFILILLAVLNTFRIK